MLIASRRCVAVLRWRASRWLDSNIAVFCPAARAAYVRLTESADVAMGSPTGILIVFPGIHVRARFHHPERDTGSNKNIAAGIGPQERINMLCGLCAQSPCTYENSQQHAQDISLRPLHLIPPPSILVRLGSQCEHRARRLPHQFVGSR